MARTLRFRVIATFALLGCVGKLGLASTCPSSAWLHPAASTIEKTSPASPSLPGEKMARSRADDGILRQAPSRESRGHDDRLDD